MKAVVGIDPASPPENVLHLLARLKMAQASAICASFAPLPFVPVDGWGVMSQQGLAGVLQAQKTAGEQAADVAGRRLAELGIPSETAFDSGDPASKLAALARDQDADLIAVGSSHQSVLESFLLGSVGRSLTLNCPCSLLIAKGEIAAEGPLRALFAYDGSPYVDRCIDELIRLAPAGIDHYDVVVVDALDSPRPPIMQRFGAEEELLSAEQRESLLRGMAYDAAERLRLAGYAARPHVVSGDVGESIRNFVSDHEIDVVVLGSQGHGWLDRTLFGSIALGQAVSESHPVLILRAEQPKES